LLPISLTEIEQAPRSSGFVRAKICGTGHLRDGRLASGGGGEGILVCRSSIGPRGGNGYSHFLKLHELVLACLQLFDHFIVLRTLAESLEVIINRAGQPVLEAPRTWLVGWSGVDVAS
jgi:hypothetical protein